MMTFKCPHCQQEIETEEENAGQEATCPNCSKPIVVPSPEPSSQAEENNLAEPSSSGTSGHWKLKKTEKEIPTVQAESGEVPVATPIPMPPVRPFTMAKPSNLSMATTALILGILSFVGVPVCGLGALILGIIAISKINRSNGMLLGKGKAIVGVVFGCWSIIRLILAFAVLLPMAAKARDRAREIACTSNLKMIAMGFALFESDHNGNIPSSMIDIQPYLNSKRVQCPASSHDLSFGEYIFVPVVENGKKIKKISQLRYPSSTPVVVCTQHKQYDIIAYADGHVEKKPKTVGTQP